MPDSLNGIGIRYIGQSDHHADGSYVTTEWFSFLYVPIVPFASFRLIHVREKDVDWGFYSKTHYRIIDRLPLRWGLVARVYLFSVSYGAWLCSLVWFLYKRLDGLFDSRGWIPLGLAVIGGWIPFAILSVLRRRAVTRARRIGEKKPNQALQTTPVTRSEI